MATPRDSPEFTVELGPGELRPGLINAHDHLYLNHYPRVGYPPYRHTGEWAEDVHGPFAEAITRAAALPREDALLFGALKNLLGGATTVVHHDRWDDRLNGGLPVRVARVRVAHSFRFERDLAAAVEGDAATRHLPLSMHLAEGTDTDAAEEVRRAARQGLLDERFLGVHLVGIDEDGIARLDRAGAAAIWCPSSNRYLFGRTAPRELFAAGIDVLLGTDSLFSGSGTLLDEIREARATAYLDDARLVDAVGAVAARRLGLPAPSLLPEHPADLILLRRRLLEARPADVGLVMVGGKPRLGDEEFSDLFERCGVPVERLLVGGVPKIVQHPLATIVGAVADLAPECTRVLR